MDIGQHHFGKFIISLLYTRGGINWKFYDRIMLCIWNYMVINNISLISPECKSARLFWLGVSVVFACWYCNFLWINTGNYLTKVSSNPGAGDILMGFLGSVILSFAFSMFKQRKVPSNSLDFVIWGCCYSALAVVITQWTASSVT